MAQPQFDLEAVGGTGRNLLMRWQPEDAWTNVGHFGSYNDAEFVLRLLRKATEPAQEHTGKQDELGARRSATSP